MTRHSIRSIAEALGLEWAGDGALEVTGLNEPARASADELAVAMDPRFTDGLRQGAGRAAIVSQGFDWQGAGLDAAIFVQRPRLAMAGLTARFRAEPAMPGGQHPSAVVDASAVIGPDVWIGPNAVIEAGAQIGPGSQIGPNAWIGTGVVLGAGARIGAGSALSPGLRAGARLITHPNVTIGGDGFSFVTPETAPVEEVRRSLGRASGAAIDAQSWIKIHSLGGVEIGDDVEIGSNSSVDAGTIRPTRIGDGTKIDALVQVGHNADIGRNVLLCAHVAVGGSARVGDNSVLGGQVGVADNVTLGTGVVAGGATKILSNVPAGRAVLGYPAMKMDSHVETYKALRRLPRLLARVARLEKAVKPDGTDG